MGKLVLGIAAVLCLDFAFIAYLYSTKEPELHASAKPASGRRPRPPKIVFPPQPNQPSVIKDPAESIGKVVDHERSKTLAAPATLRVLKQHEPAAVARKNRIYIAARKTPAKKVDRNYAVATPARRSNFPKINNETATTILYYGPRSDNDAPTVASARPRKASFASRAVAIVKKPWTWLKAAGSKMF